MQPRRCLYHIKSRYHVIENQYFYCIDHTSVKKLYLHCVRIISLCHLHIHLKATWTNKMTCAPAKTQISLGICLNYLLSAQRRLWSDWAHAQADLSLCLGTQVILLVLSCGGSYLPILLQFLYIWSIPLGPQIQVVLYLWWSIHLAKNLKHFSVNETSVLP